MTTENRGADHIRDELAATLDVIEYKINLPKRAVNRMARVRREKPGTFLAASAATVAGLVAVVVGIVVVKRR